MDDMIFSADEDGNVIEETLAEHMKREHRFDDSGQDWDSGYLDKMHGRDHRDNPRLIDIEHEHPQST